MPRRLESRNKTFLLVVPTDDPVCHRSVVRVYFQVTFPTRMMKSIFVWTLSFRYVTCGCYGTKDTTFPAKVCVCVGVYPSPHTHKQQQNDKDAAAQSSARSEEFNHRVMVWVCSHLSSVEICGFVVRFRILEGPTLQVHTSSKVCATESAQRYQLLNYNQSNFPPQSCSLERVIVGANPNSTQILIISVDVSHQSFRG